MIQFDLRIFLKWVKTGTVQAFFRNSGSGVQVQFPIVKITSTDSTRDCELEGIGSLEVPIARAPLLLRKMNPNVSTHVDLMNG